jgi:hypothetical protein
VTCAKAMCASECPTFIACAPGYGALADSGCLACLQASCAQQVSVCSKN